MQQQQANVRSASARLQDYSERDRAELQAAFKNVKTVLSAGGTIDTQSLEPCLAQVWALTKVVQDLEEWHKGQASTPAAAVEVALTTATERNYSYIKLSAEGGSRANAEVRKLSQTIKSGAHRERQVAQGAINRVVLRAVAEAGTTPLASLLQKAKALSACEEVMQFRCDKAAADSFFEGKGARNVKLAEGIYACVQREGNPYDLVTLKVSEVPSSTSPITLLCALTQQCTKGNSSGSIPDFKLQDAAAVVDNSYEDLLAALGVSCEHAHRTAPAGFVKRAVMVITRRDVAARLPSSFEVAATADGPKHRVFLSGGPIHPCCRNCFRGGHSSHECSRPASSAQRAVGGASRTAAGGASSTVAAAQQSKQRERRGSRPAQPVAGTQRQPVTNILKRAPAAPAAQRGAAAPTARATAMASCTAGATAGAVDTALEEGQIPEPAAAAAAAAAAAGSVAGAAQLRTVAAAAATAAAASPITAIAPVRSAAADGVEEFKASDPVDHVAATTSAPAAAAAAAPTTAIIAATTASSTSSAAVATTAAAPAAACATPAASHRASPSVATATPLGTTSTCINAPGSVNAKRVRVSSPEYTSPGTHTARSVSSGEARSAPRPPNPAAAAAAAADGLSVQFGSYTGQYAALADSAEGGDNDDDETESQSPPTEPGGPSTVVADPQAPNSLL